MWEPVTAAPLFLVLFVSFVEFLLTVVHAIKNAGKLGDKAQL